MVPQTIEKMEKVLAKIVARPLVQVLAELQQISTSDRGNPAPHLAMAIVRGFYGISHLDFGDFKRYLARAEKLLKQRRGARNVEWKFLDSLFRVLKNDFARVDVLERPRKLSVTERRAVAKAAIESRKALMQMGRLVSQLRDSALVNIIYAVLRSLSLSSGTIGNHYRRGMASLSRIFRGRGEARDLAGFFLIYGYRKNRNYRQALRVGQQLERRNPRAPLPKKMIGSAYYFLRKYSEAERYYKKVISLTPSDPSGPICYVRVLEKMGKLEAAKRELQKAQSLDRRRELTRVIKEVKTGMKIKESFMPRLRATDFF